MFAYVLFFSCRFEPHNTTKDNHTIDPVLTERKEALALMHLQIPYVDENTLASYVLDFFNIETSSENEEARNVKPSSGFSITKTIKIIHETETGFAETTADKRSVKSVIGPGKIPFYIFTIENQNTGKKGYALTCGDIRIGEVLAVSEEGNYDDDYPLQYIFYSCLEEYIESTIALYNIITEADVINAYNKADLARASVPVTDVGRYGGFTIHSRKELDLKVRWHQWSPYNDIINSIRKLPVNYYPAGCSPVAIAQITVSGLVFSNAFVVGIYYSCL